MSANEPATQPTSLGEMRAEWREQHLCLRCGHHAVCKMANALDPDFLVVISQCLAFEPAEPDEEMTSRWRRRADVAIAAAITRNVGLEGDELVAKVNEAYPFGERKYHPYKVWLQAMRDFKRGLRAPATATMARVCPACGAAIGAPCYEFAARWEPGTSRPTLPAGEFHEGRAPR